MTALLVTLTLEIIYELTEIMLMNKTLFYNIRAVTTTPCRTKDILFHAFHALSICHPIA